MTDRLELPQGTLDLLILKALSLGPMHGWAISERIRDVSRQMLAVPQGSLYPALHRLERKGWVASKWEMAKESKREFRYYRLTSAGKKHLVREECKWKQLACAIARVMGTAEES